MTTLVVAGADGLKATVAFLLLLLSRLFLLGRQSPAGILVLPFLVSFPFMFEDLFVLFVIVYISSSGFFSLWLFSCFVFVQRSSLPVY